MSKVGATPDTELILYGDFNNWFERLHSGFFGITGTKKSK